MTPYRASYPAGVDAHLAQARGQWAIGRDAYIIIRINPGIL